LDEPTTDWILKPEKECGSDYSYEGTACTTVFITTHYMEEAAQADYVIVIDDGQIVAKGTPWN